MAREGTVPLFILGQDTPGAPSLVVGVPYRERIKGEEGKHLRGEGTYFQERNILGWCDPEAGAGTLP